MASIWKEVVLDATPDTVWQALRNVGELHRVLVPGFVLDAQMDGDARIVTFFNGLVIREPIVTIDEERRRLVWTAVGGATSHYNAAAQVFPEGPDRVRFVWTVDLLPNGAAPAVADMMDRGLQTIATTLNRQG
ncbi:MAG: SRPBCC family protein [Chloroflexi bacterium]|nr:SRPBCC family protein [Chloroflexota bacterium]